MAQNEGREDDSQENEIDQDQAIVPSRKLKRALKEFKGAVLKHRGYLAA